MSGEMIRSPECPPEQRKNSKEVEDIVGTLIGETKVLGQRLAKINSNISGLVGLENTGEKKNDENPIGYFPRLIRALGFLGQNIEAVRKQINELDNI